MFKEYYQIGLCVTVELRGYSEREWVILALKFHFVTVEPYLMDTLQEQTSNNESPNCASIHFNTSPEQWSPHY